MVPKNRRRSSENSSTSADTHQNHAYTDEIVDTTFDYDSTIDSISDSSITMDRQETPTPDGDILNSTEEHTTPRESVNDLQSSVAAIEDKARGEQPAEASNGQHGNDDDLDGDETEVEDEDQEPPKLKYTRLSKLPARFFNKDPVSCCFFHEQVFIFATHSGFIHLCKPDFTPIRTLKAHKTSVLSLHTDGEYFASGSIDGTIVIGSITDDKDITAFDFKRPIHAVVLDKQYRITKSFISGGTSGNVVHSTRNWLNQRQDTILDSDNGPITMIKTIDDLIFWSNDSGISVGQISARAKIHHEPLPKDFPRAEIYWPKVHYSDRDRIVIGWVNHVWFFRVSVSLDPNSTHVSKILSSAASSFRTPIDKKIDVENHIILEDTLIAGISEFNDDLMVLNYVPPLRISNSGNKSKDFEPQPPELKIINKVTLEEESVDEVGLNNHVSLGLNDYHLSQYISVEGGAKWFLISANDGVIVQEFNLHDQLTWYNAKGRYLEAWKMCEFWLDKVERMNIGLRQVDSYVGEDNWKAAGDFLADVLRVGEGKYSDSYIQRVTDEWNNWIATFVMANKRNEIVDAIPVSYIYGEEFTLKEDTYDGFLDYYFSKDNFSKVIELVNKWDHMLFNVSDVAARIQDELKHYDNNATKSDDEVVLLTELRKLYVELCTELDEPELCVDHMIILKDENTMQFLDEHHLIMRCLEKLPSIIHISLGDKDVKDYTVNDLKEKLYVCIQILVENSHEVLPHTIIEVMDGADLDIFSYLYLEELSLMDKMLVKDFEDEMVKLYASYNTKSLLTFLTKHNNYSIENAIGICQEKSCISELVYLLSKVGENKKALKLIVDDLKNPQRAISFVSSVNDKELWDFLLDYSMDRPEFIKALMVASGDLIDPIPVISRIPKQVEIQGLKDALLNITTNIELDHTIYEMILKIISNETMALTTLYRNSISKGYSFNPNCHKKLLTDTLIKFSDESKPLITEEELLGGPDEVWKFTAVTHTNKITHMSFIKRQLMMLKMKMNGTNGTNGNF